MRLLAVSDLHHDLALAAEVVRRSSEADVVVIAGDLGVQHEYVAETVDALRAIAVPTVLVPGNNETPEALRSACSAWPAAHVLHGQQVELGGEVFFGLGGGVPVTPWSWSFDLTEEAARDLLSRCPAGAVLVSHSPPMGHADRSASGASLGSAAVLEAIERVRPRLVICGHVHESWGLRSRVGSTEVINAGPRGTIIDLA